MPAEQRLGPSTGPRRRPRTAPARSLRRPPTRHPIPGRSASDSSDGWEGWPPSHPSSRRGGGRTLMAPSDRQRSRERGFSLVEILVVMLILGVLLMIGLPTYLGARGRAQDRAAQSNLRTALVGALTFFSETRTYSGFGVSEAEREIPQVDWRVSGTDPGRGEVTIQIASGDDLVLVTRSNSGTYFCLRQRADSPATDRGAGTAFADVDTPAECTGGW
ncbi:MAG TPA: type II secretion system protein [Actinomycetota bacterium]|nr:type II secretion system protein [Actinomycetota bacterium]